jgi:hypothetical protein
VRRREDEPGVALPPAELTDYPACCGSRGLEPFGVPDDLASMRAAVTRWRTWCDEREAWAIAHGVDEDELGGLGSEPWDPGAI